MSGAELLSYYRLLRWGDEETVGHMKSKVKEKGTQSPRASRTYLRFCNKSELLNGPHPKDSDWDPSFFMLLTDTLYGLKDTQTDRFTTVRQRQCWLSVVTTPETVNLSGGIVCFGSRLQGSDWGPNPLVGMQDWERLLSPSWLTRDTETKSCHSSVSLKDTTPN